MALRTTSFNIDEHDYELLKDKAFFMKKRVSDVLRDLVTDFLKSEKNEYEKSKEKIKDFFSYIEELEEISAIEVREIEINFENLEEEEIKKIEKFFR